MILLCESSSADRSPRPSSALERLKKVVEQSNTNGRHSFAVGAKRLKLRQRRFPISTVSQRIGQQAQGQCKTSKSDTWLVAAEPSLVDPTSLYLSTTIEPEAAIPGTSKYSRNRTSEFKNHATADFMHSDLHHGQLGQLMKALNNGIIEDGIRGIESYREFKAFAEHLGRLSNFEDWRNHDLPSSCDYDVLRLQRRLKQAEQVRSSRNPERMLQFIRQELSRELGDMDKESLFHPHLNGTKKLIEEYTDSICSLIGDFSKLCARPRNDWDVSEAAELLEEARLAFGQTALLCSGGGTFGMRHIGTIKCLYETGNLPRVISGASAGAIVCAVLCSKTEDQLANVLESFCHGDLRVFIGADEQPGWRSRMEYFMEHNYFFDAKNLERVMKFHLGDMTFSEAYQLTGRVLNITVSSGDGLGNAEVLNYQTAGDVMLWSAVVASCALPLTYKAAPLWSKDPTGAELEWNKETPHIDGSIENDLPLVAVREKFNVNHFVVTQVNPHVVPFLEDKSVTDPHRHPMWVTFLDTLKRQMSERVVPLLPIDPETRRRLSSIMGQKYSGDITILPMDWVCDLHNVLSNPTPEFMEDAKRKGEQATWQRVSIIENHMKIERALEAASDTLRRAIYKGT